MSKVWSESSCREINAIFTFVNYDYVSQKWIINENLFLLVCKKFVYIDYMHNTDKYKRIQAEE